MAHHRKSPRSRRNLMVIDPLTPFKVTSLIIGQNLSVYPGLRLIPVNLICHITMFRKLNFDPSPRPQGEGTKKIVPVHVPFMQVTHTPNLVEFGEKNFLTPNPPTVPPSPTPGHDPGCRIKIPSDMLYIFHLLEDTQSLV